jgi:serine protease Do
MAKTVMSQLIGKGKVQRGMLGVGIQPVTSELAQGLGLKDVRGVVINSVAPGSPADKAGLKTGDVILQLNSKDVNDSNVLRNTVAGTAPGTTMTFTILRNGQQQQVPVQLGSLNENTASAGGGGGGGAAGAARLGIGVTPLTPELAARLGLRRGTEGLAVESVEANSPAAESGLQTGDVIQEVNRQPVRTTEDMRAALAKSGDRPPVLLINRGGQTAFVAVPLR